MVGREGGIHELEYMPMSIRYVKTEGNREYTVYECSHASERQDPDVVQKHAGGSKKTAGKLS